MSISNQTRKILWAKSGNKCAFPGCKHNLIHKEEISDSYSIIGEEAHIIGKKQNGPRGKYNLSINERDGYKNLILFCNIHHKIVDDLPHIYSVEKLKEFKDEHEDWVSNNLVDSNNKLKIDIKHILVEEFSMIKQIIEGKLTSLPFKNIFLLENEQSLFLKRILKTSDFRHNEFCMGTDISKEEYQLKYPMSKSISNKNEYAIFYHERIPSKKEVLEISKKDSITDYLFRNNIALEKILKIFTRQAGECGGEDEFEEAHFVRPLYMSFLLITNNSELPIKLTHLEQNSQEGILYTEMVLDRKEKINLPNISLQKGEGVLIPTGNFLTSFEKLDFSENFKISEIHLGETIQNYSQGSINKNSIIEYIGSKISATNLDVLFNNSKFTYPIHKFDYRNLYRINESIQCGSCPHVYFKNLDKELIYRGEIFNVQPNQVTTELISIPKNINALIIVELEQETTYLSEIKLNGDNVAQNVILNEGEKFEIPVSENDILFLEGFYKLDSESNSILSSMDKYNLINKYKEHYKITKVK